MGHDEVVYEEEEEEENDDFGAALQQEPKSIESALSRVAKEAQTMALSQVCVDPAGASQRRPSLCRLPLDLCSGTATDHGIQPRQNLDSFVCWCDGICRARTGTCATDSWGYLGPAGYADNGAHWPRKCIFIYYVASRSRFALGMDSILMMGELPRLLMGLGGSWLCWFG